MSEKNSWRWLSEHVFKYGDRAQRFENLLGDGTPDANCCVLGVESWIEIKQPTEPKRKSTKLFVSNHRVSQGQMNWFLSQMNSGGRAFFFIDTDKRRMLIGGKYHDMINTMTVDQLISVALWHAEKPIEDGMRNGICNDLRNCLIAPF